MTTDPEKPKKTFDCIAFKRRVQGEIYEQIKDMDHAEQIEYFRRWAESDPILSRFWKTSRPAPTTTPGNFSTDCWWMSCSKRRQTSPSAATRRRSHTLA